MRSLRAVFLGLAAVGVMVTAASADRLVQRSDGSAYVTRGLTASRQRMRARQLRAEAERLESESKVLSRVVRGPTRPLERAPADEPPTNGAGPD